MRGASPASFSMATDFFAEPDFLRLLHYWDESRKGRPLPDWDGDLFRIPEELLPHLIVSERRPEPLYRYVGAECERRWGSRISGRPIYDVLRGGHGAHVRSLGDEAIARRAPIYSAAIYRLDDDLIVTGRLFAPFTFEGSEAPQIIFALQLFRGSDRALDRLGEAGFVDETQRQMIVAVPELCGRLDQARRLHHFSRRPRPDALAQEMAALARDLTGDVLLDLPRVAGQG
jgi:hypothetical protein